MDTVAGGRCKVAWEIVCRPRDLGGLGISDLRRTGIALRVRWIWQDRRDGRLVASGEQAVMAVFQAATVFSLGNGESTYFWTDCWLNGACIRDIASAVFAAVGARKSKATVEDAMNGNAWVRHITGPRTMNLLIQFSHLCDLLEPVQLTSQPDTS